MPVRPASQGRPPERPSGAGGRPPERPGVRPGGQGAPQQRPRVTRSAAPPPPPQQRNDPFPYVMGGIIGALVVGLALVVYLLLNNQGNGGSNNTANNSNNVSNNVPVAQATSVTEAEVVDPNAAPTSEPPPRMPMEEFKALYDDPARRPLIVDVRAAEAFQQGHIQGAVNIPEAELASRVAEFPKDKLVVAYCQ